MMLSVPRNTNTSRNRNPAKLTITGNWTEKIFKIDKIFVQKPSLHPLEKPHCIFSTCIFFHKETFLVRLYYDYTYIRIYVYVYRSLYGCIIAITNCVARTVKMRYSTNTKLEQRRRRGRNAMETNELQHRPN